MLHSNSWAHSDCHDNPSTLSEISRGLYDVNSVSVILIGQPPRHLGFLLETRKSFSVCEVLSKQSPNFTLSIDIP